MKSYLKQRYKDYIFIILGILIGFLISELLFSKPDYPTAIIAVLSGLTIGELFIFRKWLKERD